MKIAVSAEPTTRNAMRTAVAGWLVLSAAMINLRFPGARLSWDWGNVLIFMGASVAPVVLVLRSLRWPAGTPRKLAVGLLAPAALLALSSVGCTAFDVAWNGPGSNCEVLDHALYAGTEIEVSRCCDGGAIGECSIEATQVWRLLPGLRIERSLGGVTPAADASGFSLDNNLVTIIVPASHGAATTIRVEVKPWVWL